MFNMFVSSYVLIVGYLSYRVYVEYKIKKHHLNK